MSDSDRAGGVFTVAVFTLDGHLEGTTVHRTADLSPKWLDVCRSMVAGCFRSGVAVVPFENLTHLSVRFTRSDGAMSLIQSFIRA